MDPVSPTLTTLLSVMFPQSPETLPQCQLLFPTVWRP